MQGFFISHFSLFIFRYHVHYLCGIWTHSFPSSGLAHGTWNLITSFDWLTLLRSLHEGYRWEANLSEITQWEQRTDLGKRVWLQGSLSELCCCFLWLFHAGEVSMGEKKKRTKPKNTYVHSDLNLVAHLSVRMALREMGFWSLPSADREGRQRQKRKSHEPVFIMKRTVPKFIRRYQFSKNTLRLCLCGRISISSSYKLSTSNKIYIERSA